MAGSRQQPPETPRPYNRGYPEVGQQAATPLGKAPPSRRGSVQSRIVRTRDITVHNLLTALAKDFAKHGESAIVACRLNKPEAYLKLIADMMVKQVNIEGTVGLTIVELLAGVQGRTIDVDPEAHLERVRERRPSIPVPPANQ